MPPVPPSAPQAGVTTQETHALLQILARIPVTQAEALWLNNLIARLQENA